jgi:UrcA family protein
MTGDRLTMPLRMAGVALGALGLALVALPVAAQSYYDNDPGYTSDDLTVTAPRTLGRSAIGAPIRNVSESRIVQTSDLDLGTSWGARELRRRIESAARSACDDLDARYPITSEDSPDCYRTAVRDAMMQAEDLTGYDIAMR